MTIHFIGYTDVMDLLGHPHYLRGLPERIEAFGVKVGIVPAASHNKYREPALDAIVADAKAGSATWTSTGTGLRSLHSDTDLALRELLKLTEATPSSDTLKRVTDDLKRYGDRFNQMRAECDQIMACAARVTPRFIDFMTMEIFKYAQRKNLLTGAPSPKVPDTLNRMLTNEENLISALGTVEWNYRYFNKILLSAGNMGAYCMRMHSLLETIRQRSAAIDSRQPARRQQVDWQLTASSVHEARRLIEYTTKNILIYSI